MADAPSESNAGEGSLQAQLANVEVMLCSHIEKMAAIRNRVAPSFPEPQHPGHTSVDMGPEISGEESSTHPLMPHHPSANTQNTQGVQNSFGSMELNAVDWHNRSLRDFLNTHIELVNQLHRSLNSEPNASVPSFVRRVSVVPLQAPVPLPSVLPSPATAKATEAEEIRSFAQQFSVIVVFSTFAAGVIIAYLQLMNDVLPAADEQNYPSATIHRELGFGMGFAGLVWNLAIATVAGANTAACASGRPWKSIEGIRSRFTAFLVAQFLGAVMFGACVGILMYPVHSGHGLVALPMAILPTSIFIAATDVASTSQEFRMLKADVKKSMSSFFRRLCCCGGQRRRRF